jgi:hypothetical protein
MNTALPDTIASYFQAKNEHDTAAMLVCFAENAIVQDEEQEYQGLTAIEEWIVLTTDKYQDTVKVTNIDDQSDETIVTGHVSGNFPGSPIELQFRFTLEVHKIVNLKIG